MGEDPTNKRFGKDWPRLTQDLLFDTDASFKSKPDLWDIRKVILPTRYECFRFIFGMRTVADGYIPIQVGHIPIPRVEYTNDALDLVVQNLTLSGRNLFPNVVTSEAHNYVKLLPYSVIKNEHHQEPTLAFGQMRADMRDVAFYYRRKSGLKITDSGLTDVVLGGDLTVSRRSYSRFSQNGIQ